MKWERLKISGIKKEKKMGGSENSFICRIYAPKGKRWPRIAISVYCKCVYISHDVDLPAFTVYCILKRNPSKRWQTVNTPIELVDEYYDIIREFKENITIKDIIE